MKKIDNEQVYMFDVDDTLVRWPSNFMLPDDGRVRIVDPNDGEVVYLYPIKRHIKLLTAMKGRGRLIVVWSGNGAAWAEAVIKALGLELSVDLIMTKPLGYVDDLSCESWMGPRIYETNGEEHEQT